jgi:hypothetical protein
VSAEPVEASAPAERSEPSPPTTGADPEGRLSPRGSLLALGLSFVGLLGVAVILFHLKSQSFGPTFYGLPSRDLFVLCLLLAVAPLWAAAVGRPRLIFIIPGVTVAFLLYPLFSPFGIPYARDSIFNFQFADVLLEMGRWVPASGVTLQAGPYSLYPASGVYDLEFALLTGLSLPVAFQWAMPVFRLFVIPLAVYALGSRLFGRRVALVGAFLYAGVPSILFNVPVQQGFAIPFMALGLMLLSYLSAPVRVNAVGVGLLAVVFASFVVLSHHLSSYLWGIWLLGLLIVPWFLRKQSRRPLLETGVVAAGYAAAFGLYTFFVSRADFQANLNVFASVTTGFLHPATLANQGNAVGTSFPWYDQLWVYAAFLMLFVGGLLALRKALHENHGRFLVSNQVIAAAVVVGTLPFLATPLNFLTLRFMEYAGLILAPSTAWWVVGRLPRSLSRTPSAAPSPIPRPRRARHRPVETAVVLVVLAIAFAGGSLAPYSTRDQFASASAILVDSPLHITPQVYATAVWAGSHLNRSDNLWGDFLTYSVFGGFGQFPMRYDQYVVFNGTSVSPVAWSVLGVGNYIVTDRYMSSETPQFYGPANDQPAGPMTSSQLQKFNNPTYFDTIYEDSTFTIYEVVARG